MIYVTTNSKGRGVYALHDLASNNQLEASVIPVGCDLIGVANAIKKQCCTSACATKLFSPIVGCAADVMTASQCTIYDAIIVYSGCDCDFVPDPNPIEQDVQNDP